MATQINGIEQKEAEASKGLLQKSSFKLSVFRHFNEIWCKLQYIGVLKIHSFPLVWLYGA
jgi:hypothetical protein